MGKTSLVRAFAAARRPALLGSCENLTTATPLGPFLDVGIELDGEPRRVAAALLRRARPDAAARARGRALGRPGDARRPARARPAHRRDARRSCSRPTATTRSSGDHPLRIVLGELASAPGVTRLSRAAALARRGARARGATRRRRRRDPPAHARQRVLRHRDPGRRRRRAARDGARRGARAGGRPRAGGATAARGRLGRAGARRALAARGRRARRSRAARRVPRLRRARAPTATGSRSGTSSRGSPSRARSRRTAAGRSTRRSCALSKPAAISRGSPTTPRRPGTPPPCSSTPRRRRSEAAAARAAPRGRGAVRACAPACGRAGDSGAGGAPRPLTGRRRDVTGQYDESIDARLEAIELYRELGDTLRRGRASVPPDDPVHRARAQCRGRGREP